MDMRLYLLAVVYMCASAHKFVSLCVSGVSVYVFVSVYVSVSVYASVSSTYAYVTVRLYTCACHACVSAHTKGQKKREGRREGRRASASNALAGRVWC